MFGASTTGSTGCPVSVIGVTATSSPLMLDTRTRHGQPYGGSDTPNLVTVGLTAGSMRTPLLLTMLQSPDPRRASLPQTEIVTVCALKPSIVTMIRSPGDTVVLLSETTG